MSDLLTMFHKAVLRSDDGGLIDGSVVATAAIEVLILLTSSKVAILVPCRL